MNALRPVTDEKTAPTVSIGLPVYNGENYLREAIRSILEQTFTDFELIISDNGSCDRTEEICRSYAEIDSRIRYYRNRMNLGAAANWNRVFELARGAYFKWIAHDDLHAPSFVIRCLEELERDPSAVLAFTRAVTVGPDGQAIREWAGESRLTGTSVVDRYRVAMQPSRDPLPLAVFGVMRSNVVRASRLFRWYPDADIALVAELSLHGRFVEVPEPLFIHREHRGRAGPRLARNVQEALAFWDPSKTGQVRFPHWSLALGHLSGLLSAPARFADRGRCLLIFAGWCWRSLNRLWWDLVVAASRLPALGRGVSRLAAAIRLRRWRFDLARARRDLLKLMPPSTVYVLVDGGEFGTGLLTDRTERPLIDNWGPPPDDVTAISEFERKRSEGASLLVFGWPCFWWLTYYRGFAAHLDERFSRVLQNDRLIVYDLRDPGNEPVTRTLVRLSGHDAGEGLCKALPGDAARASRIKKVTSSGKKITLMYDGST